ncbi:MAG: hypothetical protein EPO51_16450 [Phenylobacterium sp.]|uniref:hypothetical protein n=1 Tax=Phenylobacterium sp. TaxID=1871053 RepID=UPI001214EAF5|nr:hypothetical protein [Phenylobacterium sp.]TAJ70680.1 MAG: hypothetical protein EPO51_16450 [Phenylobacterium sp.]
MDEAHCPSCKKPIHKVRPVRIPTDTDDRARPGRTPDAIGFICSQCGVLLPLVSRSDRDDI